MLALQLLLQVAVALAACAQAQAASGSTSAANAGAVSTPDPPPVDQIKLTRKHAALTEAAISAARRLLSPLARSTHGSAIVAAHAHGAQEIIAGNSSLRKVILPSDLVEAHGAVCLDGSDFAYYFDPADADSPDANKFVMYLQGGGLCVEPIDCEVLRRSCIVAARGGVQGAGGQRNSTA